MSHKFVTFIRGCPHGILNGKQFMCHKRPQLAACDIDDESRFMCMKDCCKICGDVIPENQLTVMIQEEQKRWWDGRVLKRRTEKK